MIVTVLGKRKDWNFWTWLLWSLFIYSVLEAGTFFMAWLALKSTAGELVVPYIAFVVPGAIFLSSVWWLNTWAERGAPIRRLARGWGLSAVLSVLALAVAVAYSGVKLGLVNPTDAVDDIGVAALMGATISYFSAYHTALARISSRAGARDTTRMGLR